MHAFGIPDFNKMLMNDCHWADFDDHNLFTKINENLEKVKYYSNI